MGVSQVHVIGGVKLHPDSFGVSPAVQLGGLTRLGLRIANQVLAMPTSGQALADFIALYGQQFAVMWETLQLAAALDACGVSGTPIAATTNTGLTLYAQKGQEGGTRATGAAHDNWNIKEGIMYPSSLSCDHQGDARLQYDAIPTWDGTNNPIVIAKDAALPAPNSDNQRFTLGPIQLGGVAFTQVRSVQIDFGIGAQAEGADSDIWDRYAWIAAKAPSLVINGINKRWLDSTGIPLTGLICTHANSFVVLRKRAVGGTYVAAGTAEHVTFTFAGLAVVPTIFEAAGNTPGTVSISVPLYYDGTNQPLVVDTTTTHA